MKDTFYFSHDYNTREDEKIKKLIYKHSWEGYGLYWAIVEMLYNNDGYLVYECDRIAFELRSKSKLIESIINDFDLFKMKEDSFYSSSVNARLKERKKKSLSARKSAETRWGKEKAKDATALRTQSESNAIKERKGKETKSKVNNRFTPPSLEEVQFYCLERENKVDPEKFIDFYSSKGWFIGKNKMKDWEAAVRTWEKSETAEKKGKNLYDNYKDSSFD